MPHDDRPMIAFQGEPGANSDMACASEFGDTYEPLPCPSFDDAFAALKAGSVEHDGRTRRVERAMIPIENTLAGRVADIHLLMPDSGLQIVGEYFMPIHFQLMALKGVSRSEIRSVHSHIHALGQCRKYIRANGWKPVVAGDTAGAAREVSESGDRSKGALAPLLAAQRYGLDILEEDVEDAANNVTRFVILANPDMQPLNDPDEQRLSLWTPRAASLNETGRAYISRNVVTTFVFRVKNIPAALYKALGGFATNAINMTKLESYQLGGSFSATLFYADVEGHPHDPALGRALEELRFFSAEYRNLGVYPAAENRHQLLLPGE
ncbi:prephenate dehydratase [Aurantimonas sp. VKM B-3413]|uniref:prephenate dehydratase n=1 Tax=Aurantimonas sp. VKM B-3413 TaxID=2779401 RepID=UPI001E34CD8D|nr:prephenate dehydratase [Aurantimonas sp. VKM B-3413]MCB8837168.1 prephenate dehydratase [Aurantimonas sp. VKM B-3413]